MLDIPDELFGSSFSMVTNISKIFGDVITVGLDLHCVSLSSIKNHFVFSASTIEFSTPLWTVCAIFQTAAWKSAGCEGNLSTSANNNHD